jgi:hypothetical protein
MVLGDCACITQNQKFYPAFLQCGKVVMQSMIDRMYKSFDEVFEDLDIAILPVGDDEPLLLSDDEFRFPK